MGYAIRPHERRKGYGTLALGLALGKAAEMGIVDVLVTWDADHTASRRIIEANGGRYENAIPQGRGRPDKLRYWRRHGPRRAIRRERRER